VSTSPDAGALSRDARREAVRQFDDQGLSARAIATRLGVGKDTVRRDLEALRQAAPPATPVPDDGAPVRADRLTMVLDGTLREDLAVLAEAGRESRCRSSPT
jgi:transposase